jgi:hypothetical protein
MTGRARPPGLGMEAVTAGVVMGSGDMEFE